MAQQELTPRLWAWDLFLQPSIGKCRMDNYDLDLIEANEAFAAQALAVIRDLGLNLEITNVNGGTIALGHRLVHQGQNTCYFIMK